MTPHLPLYAPLPACEPPDAVQVTPTPTRPAQRPTAPRPEGDPAE